MVLGHPMAFRPPTRIQSAQGVEPDLISFNSVISAGEKGRTLVSRTDVFWQTWGVKPVVLTKWGQHGEKMLSSSSSSSFPLESPSSSLWSLLSSFLSSSALDSAFGTTNLDELFLDLNISVQSCGLGISLICVCKCLKIFQAKKLPFTAGGASARIISPGNWGSQGPWNLFRWDMDVKYRWFVGNLHRLTGSCRYIYPLVI